MRWFADRPGWLQRFRTSSRRNKIAGSCGKVGMMMMGRMKVMMKKVMACFVSGGGLVNSDRRRRRCGCGT